MLSILRAIEPRSLSFQVIMSKTIRAATRLVAFRRVGHVVQQADDAVAGLARLHQGVLGHRLVEQQRGRVDHLLRLDRLQGVQRLFIDAAVGQGLGVGQGQVGAEERGELRSLRSDGHLGRGRRSSGRAPRRAASWRRRCPGPTCRPPCRGWCGRRLPDGRRRRPGVAASDLPAFLSQVSASVRAAASSVARSVPKETIRGAAFLSPSARAWAAPTTRKEAASTGTAIQRVRCHLFFPL